MILKFMTIGVYGFDESTFFDALIRHNVGLFCDIRYRRGMRGAKYAFVNSIYLQKKLKALGIGYIHRKDLAPNNAIRDVQRADDQCQKITKRNRAALSPAFIKAYNAACLTDFNAQKFVDSFGIHDLVVVLFCVEQDPKACHRSLITDRLEMDLNIHTEHILP
ncbi:MAG: hypothetical protein B6244_04485 [Candidatus Cloacimonetes bacterium 4572_55]|nr:MAG: hypothetical protein B6244_04485 [Candidatus Cloacimonetes bacterium 4572_55]